MPGKPSTSAQLGRATPTKSICVVRPGAPGSVHVLDCGKHVAAKEKRQSPIERAWKWSSQSAEGCIAAAKQRGRIFNTEIDGAVISIGALVYG